MDIIVDVPFLQDHDSVDLAMNRMQQADLAAVVVQHNNRLALPSAGALGEAQEQGIQQMAPEQFEVMGEPLAAAGAGVANFVAFGPLSRSQEQQWGLAGYAFAGRRLGDPTTAILSDGTTPLLR